MHGIRVLTYNIHKGIGGLDRRYRLERVIGVIAACDADLVFLQEVDEDVPRSRRDRQVDMLGDALGYEHRAYFPNVELKRGRYGNALLSRVPFDHAENIDLTIPLKKRRGALHARVSLDVHGARSRVWLFNVHLGLAEFERRWQLRRLLDWQRHHHPPGEAAIVLAGDLNDVWGRLGPVVLEPAGFRGSRRGVPTFPAVRPVRPLDRVFVSGPIEIAASQSVRHGRARLASDHLPLVADLSL
jgi:endonuclease/exonuclease/phosphatase family metal-dependent hydrolase